jgi:dUTP pyrophosphatase
MSPGSAGFDLFAAEDVTIPAARVVKKKLVEIGHRIVRTGICISLPANSVGRIASRSGLSIKENLEIGAGWIDPDYRGEILVELKNFSANSIMISRGERIAQLIVLKTVAARVKLARLLRHTERGTKGVGSTGRR